MSMNSPRRAQSNKKPRGGGSYHYRPKARNGSGGNANNQGGKNNGGQQHSKYRDLKAPPGIDSGPSDDGGPPDSDDKHHSLAKPRSRYDRYDRFGSTSPKLSPKFGGQRQGNNRRGNNANSDRPRENRRGSGRSKFSGRAPYDDDDVEEESTSFGRRSARNHSKRHGDRGGYRYRQGDRELNRDDRRDGDSGGKWDDGRDYQSGRDRSRYGYTDMGDRGQHYGRPRTQNPHSRVPQPPVLDNLINIFHEYHNDTTDMTDDTAVVPPPSANDGTHVYPIDWLMLQRKKPQHKIWPGPTLPDLVNRNLNPTPPPDESSGRYGSHKETNIRPHSEIPSTGSWRTPKFGSRSREDPPKTDLADPGDDSKPRRGAPIKPPIHNSGSGRTVEDLEAVAARARETSEDENPEQQQTTETQQHQPKSERRKRDHETPEWDSAGAPQDMWGAYTFGKLDRNKDLQNLNETGQLLDVDQVVVREKQDDETPTYPQEQSQRKNESKTWKAEMDEDEASDPEVVQKQIEQMNLADDDDDFPSGGGSGPNYGGLGIGLGVEQPDISGFKTNPWGKLLPPQDSNNSKTSSADAVELNIDSVLDEFRYGTSGDVSEPSPEKATGQEPSPTSDAAASKTRSPTSNEPVNDTQGTPGSPHEVTTPGQGEPSVISGTNAGGEGNGNGTKQPQQQPTEEQFRWYEEKLRRYYYQSVLFHQKYKKYERLYIEANEVMMADPSRRDPHMEKYVEKYQQYRQRFHLVYDKYRRYRHFLENYGRKISVHQQPHDGYGQAYHGAPYGAPEHGGPSGHGQPMYHDPNRHRFPPGPYGEPGRGGDPRDPRFMYYQQQEYYQGRRHYPQETGEPYYDPRDPRRGDPHDPRSRGPPGPYVGVPPHGPPRGGPPRGPPPRGEYYDPAMYGGPYPPRMPKPQPHVPGSSALKIEKPPRSGSASQPNMEDDTKTTPADNSGKKETNGEAVPGTNPKPSGTEKESGAQPGTDENFMAHLMLGDTHGRAAAPNGGDEPSTNTHFPQGGGAPHGGADYNEPPEYPASFYRSGVAPRDESSRGGGIDLSDLGYTTAPSGRGNRDRDPRREQMIPGMGHPRGGPDLMDRNRAVQYADDYARFYSRSSGGGMTRSEFEEYEQQQQQQKKRRHYLEHYRQYGYYPGSNPPPPHPRMHGPGGHHPRHEGSPPNRQPSPGNPEYYPGYPPAGRYEQPNYGYGPPQGDYPPQYYRGQYDE